VTWILNESYVMTKLVDQAVAAIAKLPAETQDDLARFMLALASGSPKPLSPDEAAAIAEAEIGRGERVPPEVIQDFWRSHGL
jgi:hypothetical protein